MSRRPPATALAPNEMRSTLIVPSLQLKSLLIRTGESLKRMLAPFGFRLSRKVAGHKFVFDPATDIGWKLLIKGRFEQAALNQCANYIRHDGVVLDVGANIGVHTVHFANLARFGTVVSFEPAKATFRVLIENVEHLANVIPLNLALSDATGVHTFFVAADNAFSGLKDTNRKAILRKEFVACFKGDDVLLALFPDRRIDLIKIDVEGLETQVLTGMREFIVTHKPVIFCEIYGGTQSNPNPQSTVDFCLSLGYDAFVLNGTELLPAGVHSDSLYNYFFIPRSRNR